MDKCLKCLVSSALDRRVSKDGQEIAAIKLEDGTRSSCVSPDLHLYFDWQL